MRRVLLGKLTVLFSTTSFVNLTSDTIELVFVTKKEKQIQKVPQKSVAPVSDPGKIII
jgi:hypothetical protein